MNGAAPGRRGGGLGVTMVELLVVLAIIAILALIATGTYTNSVTRARITAAFVEIHQMEMACERYRLDVGQYPPSSSGTLIPPASPALDQDSTGLRCGYMTLCLLHSLNGNAVHPLDPRWRGPYLEVDREQLGLISGQAIDAGTPLPQIQMLDPWGTPYRYLRFDNYAAMGGTWRPATDPFSVTETFYNVNTIQIVSNGPNGVTLPAPQTGLESDDVTNFTRGGSNLVGGVNGLPTPVVTPLPRRPTPPPARPN